MSPTARHYGLALALPMLAAIGACSDSSVLAPERLAPRAPSRNVIAGVVATVQLCARGVAGQSSYTISYTPGPGSTSTYNLPQGAALTLSSGSCATVFTVTLNGQPALDPEAHVIITQVSGPFGSVLDYTIKTELSEQAACVPESVPCGVDVTGTSATVDTRVNGYHGSVVSFWNKIPAHGCAFTLGYWKNHTSVWPAGYSPNAIFYGSGLSWINLWNTPPKGSAYIILAHQFMAATLNVANGAYMPPATKTVYDLAAAYFAGGAGGDLIGWAAILDAFNNGLASGGAPHCFDH
jgi:hypothetical protein